jgi:hypothetical protein
MVNLPKPVLNFLYSTQIELRSPAYLLLDKRGILLEWGGSTLVYGIDNLSKGELIQPQVSVLAEMIPFTESTSCIKFVRFGPKTADVHLFSTKAGDWVVLLDTSPEEEQIRPIQQERNELRAALTRLRNRPDELGQRNEPNLLDERNAELRKALDSIERDVKLLRQIMTQRPKR